MNCKGNFRLRVFSHWILNGKFGAQRILNHIFFCESYLCQVMFSRRLFAILLLNSSGKTTNYWRISKNSMSRVLVIEFCIWRPTHKSRIKSFCQSFLCEVMFFMLSFLHFAQCFFLNEILEWSKKSSKSGNVANTLSMTRLF